MKPRCALGTRDLRLTRWGPYDEYMNLHAAFVQAIACAFLAMTFASSWTYMLQLGVDNIDIDFFHGSWGLRGWSWCFLFGHLLCRLGRAMRKSAFPPLSCQKLAHVNH